MGGPDYSSLGETPPSPPEKTPEKLELDDDDDVEETPKPKTLMDYLKEKPEESKDEEPEKVEDEAKKEESEEDEPAEDEAEPEKIEEDAELEPDIPEMTAEEEPLAATEIIDERKLKAKAEKEQAKTKEDQAEASTAEAFLDNAKDEIKDGKSVDEALEAAQQKTLEAAGIDVPEEPPEAELPPVPPEVPPEIPEVPPAEEDPTAVPPPPVPPATPPTPPTPPRGPGGTGLPPVGPGGPGGPGGVGSNVLPPTPNVLPITPAEDDTSTRRVSTGGAVLAGGLVGYLLGRRRGRIKTEKKLLPIQHKLEKEVAELHSKIAWREASIRSLAREHAASAHEAGDEIVERLKTHHERKAGDNERDAEKLHTTHPERLGKFVVDTEHASQSEAFSAPERQKPVDVMTLPELLAIAERVKIEDSTVKRLFETNRLNDEGLRRVIRAYLRGERYERVITDNLQTPEKYPYPETLQRNTVEGNPLQASGLTPVNVQDQADPSLSMINPAANATLPPAYNQSELPVQKKAPPTGAIVVGTIIAILILIFLATR